MDTHLPLAAAASLIADPARAAMLLALLDGRALAAGELARCARVSPQSASNHLAYLLQSGFVEVASQGRHRYYRIASADVAHAVEALGTIATPRKRRPLGESEEVRFARTCYDHVAGRLSVGLAEFLERREFLTPLATREFGVTEAGKRFFRTWNIDVEALKSTRRVLAGSCLDWTERRYHVAGALGAAMCQSMLERRWIARGHTGRVVHLTATGHKELARLFEVARVDDDSDGAETSFCASHSS